MLAERFSLNCGVTTPGGRRNFVNIEDIEQFCNCSDIKAIKSVAIISCLILHLPFWFYRVAVTLAVSAAAQL